MPEPIDSPAAPETAVGVRTHTAGFSGDLSSCPHGLQTRFAVILAFIALLAVAVKAVRFAGSPVPLESPAGTKTHTAKFSDLNAYFQGLQTRLAVIIALIALLVAVGGAIRPLLPSYPPDARPLLVYAVAVLLVFAVVSAGAALAVPGELPWLIEQRLASRALASADDVDDKLHKKFLEEIKRRHRLLDRVHNSLAVGATWFICYFFIALLHPHFSEMVSSILSERSCYAIGSPHSTAACSVDYISVIVVLLGAAEMVHATLSDWLAERRRLKTAAKVAA